MEASEKSKQYVNKSVQKVAKIIDDCCFITPSDIDGKKVETWRTELRKKGKSSRFVNSYIVSFKSLILWMLREGYISSNPISIALGWKKLRLPTSFLTLRNCRLVLGSVITSWSTTASAFSDLWALAIGRSVAPMTSTTAKPSMPNFAFFGKGLSVMCLMRPIQYFFRFRNTG